MKNNLSKEAAAKLEERRARTKEIERHMKNCGALLEDVAPCRQEAMLSMEGTLTMETIITEELNGMVEWFNN
ncbi:hypothetical protein EAF00_012044 [Botryotinia globosa]|nr:hypothetical protein EAF00_012044 [Botryotinia globosa]